MEDTMKRILFTLAVMLALTAPAEAQYMSQYKLDSLGVADVNETWTSPAVTAYHTVLSPHYGLVPAQIKILSGAAATVYLYEEYLIENDSSRITGEYDTLRGPVPYYDIDAEAMVFTGQVTFTGSAIKHLQLVDPSAYGRLRIYTTSAVVPGIKVMVAW
jgi:hypothetical protein